MVVWDIIVDVVGDALTIGCAAEMMKFMNIVLMYHVIKQQHQRYRYCKLQTWRTCSVVQ